MQTDLGGTEMPPVPLSLFTPQSLSGGAGRGERGQAGLSGVVQGPAGELGGGEASMPRPWFPLARRVRETWSS